MPRACTICRHVACAEIDATLSQGASLDAVLAQFDLPSRSALQRHRVSHLGRAVTMHLPATNAQTSGKLKPTVASHHSEDAAIALELTKLLEQANSSDAPSVQQVARLTLNGLLRIHAAASLSSDHTLNVRALRELRSMLALFVGTSAEKAAEGIGWAPLPEPRTRTIAMLDFILAGTLPSERRAIIEEQAAAELDAFDPGLGTSLLAESSRSIAADHGSFSS